MSETEAIALAQKGDPDAFRVLYDLYKQAVLQRCTRMLRNPEDAEDVTQEIFLLLHRKIKHFRNDSSFSTWLYRMTTTKVLDCVRRKRARIPCGADSENMRHPTVDPKPLLRLELEEAISTLPERDKQLVDLRQQGFSLREISEKNGWGGKAASFQRLQRINRTLRTAMA